MILQKLRIGTRLALAFGLAAAAIVAIAVYGGTYALVAFDGKDAAASRAAHDLAYTLFAFGAIAALLVAALAWAVTRSVTAPLGVAIGAARSAASGDLAARVTVSGRDEAAEFLAALRTMNENLSAIVARARAGAETIERGSTQVATGAQNLAARTEDEASTLAEAAATLEEFTAAVRQNAEHADNASRLAAETSKIATEGNAVVGRVVATMDEIAESSKRIADIVSFIDGIAFQTNILALNAAVEAARAGEQGRGFAVVAAEVRSLAQRSAASAAEIRSLIQASLGKVEAGSREARAAGEAMDDILTSINIVSEVVSQIADAGREQSAGVGQINVAVSKLDAVTQANASLAGETTEAARRMRREAGDLAGTLAHFRVGAAPSPAPVPAPVEAERLPPPEAGRRRKAAALARRPTAPGGKPGEEWAEF